MGHFAEAKKHHAVGCSASNCHGSITSGVVVHGPVKAGGCDLCHKIGGNGKAVNVPNHPKILTLSGDELKATCLGCHDDDHGGFIGSKVVHGAIKKEGCLGCHDPHHSSHRRLLKNETTVLCLSCHQEMGKKIEEATVKHGALDDSKSCANCHTPHSSDFPKLLKATERETCLGCHNKELKTSDGRVIKNMKKWIEAATFQHKPVKNDRCLPCHTPHGGSQRALLSAFYTDQMYAKFDEKNSDLCFTCHEPELATTEHATSETDFRNGTTNLHYLHLHQGDKGRTCRACHDPHGTRNPKMIQEWIPYDGKLLPLEFKKTSSGGSCATACHRLRSYDRDHEVTNEKTK